MNKEKYLGGGLLAVIVGNVRLLVWYEAMCSITLIIRIFVVQSGESCAITCRNLEENRVNFAFGRHACVRHS